MKNYPLRKGSKGNYQHRHHQQKIMKKSELKENLTALSLSESPVIVCFALLRQTKD